MNVTVHTKNINGASGHPMVILLSRGNDWQPKKESVTLAIEKKSDSLKQSPCDSSQGLLFFILNR